HLLKQHTDPQHLGTVINGISRIGHMKGGEDAEWIDEDFPFVLTKKASQFINENKRQPFFLFFSLHDIHQPRVPHVKFVESSTMGPRGDVITQLDWCVGELIKQLEDLGLKENTLIIFTSDNGPVLDDGYVDYAREMVGDHQPAGVYRGGKYSGFEAGTRVPTIVNWPGKVKPGQSAALVGQTDLLASLSTLVQSPIEENVLDSRDYLDAWLGKDEIGREYLVEEAYAMGLRWKNWKYIQPTRDEQPGWITAKFIEAGYSSKPQLYNLDNDPGEQNNVAEDYPKITLQLTQKLEEIMQSHD
ncbi:MAG: sulfatase-like hydrolase/transferase, partial [Bacteroidota bacterium]